MMETEISEGNKLIAEFMGYEDYKQTGAVIKGASMKFVLCYNCVWSELIQVVEKIESIKANPTHSYGDFKVTIYQCTCIIHKLNSQPISKGYGEYKIEAVWLAVVDFINWFNENLKKNQ